jgi:hypothetical protein
MEIVNTILLVMVKFDYQLKVSKFRASGGAEIGSLFYFFSGPHCGSGEAGGIAQLETGRAAVVSPAA